MDPLTLTLLGLGTAGSLFGGGQQQKPLSLEQITQMFGPEAVSRIQQQLFNRAAGSEAFRGAQARTNIAAQGFGQQVNKNLANAGLSGTGVGAIGNAAASSAGGFALNDLISKLFESTLSDATGLNQTLAGIFQGERNQPQQPSALQGASGALLGAIGPLLLRGKAGPAVRPAGANNAGFSFGGSGGGGIGSTLDFSSLFNLPNFATTR